MRIRSALNSSERFDLRSTDCLSTKNTLEYLTKLNVRPKNQQRHPIFLYISNQKGVGEFAPLISFIFPMKKGSGTIVLYLSNQKAVG
jgi:hypothetical protein